MPGLAEEEVDLEPLEARSDDLMNEFFKVSARPPEGETVKVRKRDGCHARSTQVPLHIRDGNRARKDNHEGLQLRHEGKKSQKSIWAEVGGSAGHDKECDEARSSRE